MFGHFETAPSLHIEQRQRCEDDAHGKILPSGKLFLKTETADQRHAYDCAYAERRIRDNRRHVRKGEQQEARTQIIRHADQHAEQRIKARRLLALDHAQRSRISECAEEVGFGDAAYFSKIFKRFTGKSPSYYKGRKNNN